MARISISSGVFISFLDDGTVNASGTVTIYDAGSTTLSTFYSQESGGSAAANPITLDSAGRAKIWLPTDRLYDITVKDSSGSTIYTEDSIGHQVVDSYTSAWNYVLNPSFEDLDTSDATLPANWTIAAVDGCVVDTTTVRHGKYSLKFTSTGTGGGTATSTMFPVTVDRDLDIYVLHKFSGATVGAHIYIEWFQSDKTTSAGSDTDVFNSAAGNPTSWQEDSSTSVTPISGATWARLVIDGATSAGASGTYNIDGIQIIDSVAATGITSSTKTGNYTVLSSDAGNIIYCDTTSGSITITMPAISDGFQVGIKKIAAANSVLVQTAGAAEIRTMYGKDDYVQLTGYSTTSWNVTIDQVTQPAFMAVKQSNQTGIGTSATKITWDAESYDYCSNFGSHKFTAPYDGLYEFGIKLNNLTTIYTYLYVNGSDSGLWASSTTGGTSSSSAYTLLVELTAADYVEVYVAGATAGRTVYGDASDNRTFWWGRLVKRRF